MNSEMKRGRSQRSRFAASLALLFGLLTAGAASAQGWPVYDNLHTLKNVMGWMEAHKQDLKEIDQWKKQAEHYKQQLADAQKIFDAQSMTMTMDFTERPLNFGMQGSCQDKTGNGDKAISDKITSVPMSYAPIKSDPKGEIKKEQLKVCQQIVFMQNSKYNEMIKMLKNIQQRDKELKKLDEYRKGVGTSEGRLATSSNQFSAFMARASMDLQYSQTAIATYEGYIAHLKGEQEKLALRAMKGDDSSLFKSLAQGAILRGSFTAIRAARSN